MRKLSFVVGLMAAVLCLSCSSDDGNSSPREELLGTWIFERYADYIVESGDLLGTGKDGPNLVLNSDNTCICWGYNGTYSTSGSTITFHYKTSWSDGTHVEEHSTSCKIEELTADKLTLSHRFETHLNGNLYSTECIGYEYYNKK